MTPPAGIYLSIPFCKAKCSFCNFASDVFAGYRLESYVEHLCREIAGARTSVEGMGAELPETVDSVYFGGGTPSLLEPEHLDRIFGTLRENFTLAPGAEMTVECAPGQLAESTLEAMLRHGVNRVSFGVQSFIDREAAAVGRLHTGAQCLAELDRMRRAGVPQRSLDLIVGLPHQTAESWRYSIGQAVGSGAEHLSLYMLEVDEDSRLGREILGPGSKYGAAQVPSDDQTADWYAEAVGWLAEGGVGQYEISNFARVGCESRHNRKYWLRAPYLGFGLDAHSMLPAADAPLEAVRWANPEELDAYLARHAEAAVVDPVFARFPAVTNAREVDRVGLDAAFDECLFLGLRMNAGVDLGRLRADYPAQAALLPEMLPDLVEAGLIALTGERLALTAAGRMVSNEVFSRLLLTPA